MHFPKNILNQVDNQTQAIVTTLTAAFILYTRSLGVVYFVVGALACAFDETLLLLVPLELAPLAFPRGGLVAR